MSAHRKAVPTLGSTFRMLCRAQFHTSRQLRANPKQRSPRTRAQASNNSRQRMLPTKFSSPEALPPLALLESASKSGALDVEPNVAIQALRQYQLLSQAGTAGWEKQLCAEFGIQPSTLTLLAMVLNRCSREDQRLFGFELLLSASALGDALAIFTLVERGLKRNSLHEPLYADALRRLNVLAKEDRNRRAMLLLGKVLSAQGKSSDALKHFRSATRLSSENGEYFLTFEGAGEALVLEGRMLSDQGDKTGSKTAFQKAALELDEPSAFYHLAMGEEADSSSRKIYLMKAASSGILEACHELGSLELKQMEEGPDVAKSPSLSDYGMAREWFQVAASGGFGPSMLSLALICKSAGRREEGLRWLETAKALPEFRTQALAWESLGKMND